MVRWLNTSTMDATDSTSLDLIARQCPLSGGKAVYQARALMQANFPELVYSDVACGNGNARTQSPNPQEVEQEDQAAKFGIQLVPNPASDEVRILLSEPGMEIMIYDLHGHLVADLNLDGKESHLDLSNWTRGVYLVRYRNSQGLSGGIRMVLQ